MNKKRSIRVKAIVAFLGYNLILVVVFTPFVLFWGPFQALKVMAVGSVYTSRHPQVVKAFLSQTEIDRIMNLNNSQGISASQTIGRTKVIADTGSGITIEDIQGPSFKGKVMLIKDPKRIKVAVTKEIGLTGERVSDLVKDMGAVAGINAGGFYDPNGKGNGAFPDGLTVHDGRLVHNNVGDKAVNIVGFNDQGKLIIGNMTASQIAEKHINEAVTFGPNLIVDGRPVISGDGGWGIAPRTGIGQMADGTVIFVVIDGRQPTWSIGATLHNPVLTTEWGGTIPYNNNVRTLLGAKGQMIVYDRQTAYIVTAGRLTEVKLHGDENYVSVDGAELIQLTKQGASTLVELQPL